METTLFNAIGFLGILVIAGFSIKSNIDINKKADEINEKVGGAYKRLDKVKEDFELKHVRKDVCGIVHEQLSRDVTEIKCDVKKLLMENNKDNA